MAGTAATFTRYRAGAGAGADAGAGAGAMLLDRARGRDAVGRRLVPVRGDEEERRSRRRDENASDHEAGPPRARRRDLVPVLWLKVVTAGGWRRRLRHGSAGPRHRRRQRRHRRRRSDRRRLIAGRAGHDGRPVLARPCGGERQDRAPELLDRRKPLRRLELHRPQDRRLQRDGNVGAARARRQERPLADAADHLVDGLALVGALARQALGTGSRPARTDRCGRPRRRRCAPARAPCSKASPSPRPCRSARACRQNPWRAWEMPKSSTTGRCEPWRVFARNTFPGLRSR